MSLDYQDMKGQLAPKVSIDEYAARMGKDKDVITVTFNTKSELSAEDLVNWFEHGYKFVLDADLSDGKVKDGRRLVFVELKREPEAIKHIVTLITDLKTLTDIPVEDWKVVVDGKGYKVDEDVMKKVIIADPIEYETAHPEEPEQEEQPEEQPPEEDNLNEYRELAGLDRKKKVYKEDEYIKNLKAIAGL